MKILHIIFSFNIGGSETMLVDIINKQVQKHEVTLCVINNLYDEKLLNTIGYIIRPFKSFIAMIAIS